MDVHGALEEEATALLTQFERDQTDCSLMIFKLCKRLGFQKIKVAVQTTNICTVRT